MREVWKSALYSSTSRSNMSFSQVLAALLIETDLILGPWFHSWVWWWRSWQDKVSTFSTDNIENAWWNMFFLIFIVWPMCLAKKIQALCRTIQFETGDWWNKWVIGGTNVFLASRIVFTKGQANNKNVSNHVFFYYCTCYQHLMLYWMLV